MAERGPFLRALSLSVPLSVRRQSLPIAERTSTTPK